jgi:hypothetical protein
MTLERLTLGLANPYSVDYAKYREELRRLWRLDKKRGKK